MTNSSNLVLNNVLCYITSSYESKTIECIIDCCLPYYSFAQIKAARDLLVSYNKCEISSSGHKGTKSTKNLLTEILDFLKYCKDNQIELPTFVSNSYNSMPPVSGYEIIGGTLSVLIDEIYSLKEELKMMKQDVELSRKCSDTISIKNDLIQIKQSLKDLKHESSRDELQRTSLASSTGFNKRNIYEKTSASRKLSLPNDINSGLNNTDICLSDHLFGPIHNSDPSAPTLSQFSDLDSDLSEPTLTQLSSIVNKTMPPTPELFSSKVKSIVSSLNDKSPLQNIKQNPIIKVKSVAAPNPRGPKTVTITDDEGFISKIKRKPQATGTRKPNSYINLRGAQKNVDLFVGRCDNDITSEDVMTYIEKELKMKAVSCTELQTRVSFSKSFKLTININDRNTLMSDDSWPEGIICRKYYNKQS